MKIHLQIISRSPSFPCIRIIIYHGLPLWLLLLLMVNGSAIDAVADLSESLKREPKKR